MSKRISTAANRVRRTVGSPTLPTIEQGLSEASSPKYFDHSIEAEAPGLRHPAMLCSARGTPE